MKNWLSNSTPLRLILSFMVAILCPVAEVLVCPRKNTKQHLIRQQQLGQCINAPCYYIPGNHDLHPETGAKDSYLARFGINGMGSTCFVHENIRFILLDSQEVPEDLTHGYVSTNQLAWVERELKRASDYDQEVFIFSHQLPFPNVEFQGIGSRIANSAEMLEVMTPFDEQILAFFCGHSASQPRFPRTRHALRCLVRYYLLSDDVATGLRLS